MAKRLERLSSELVNPNLHKLGQKGPDDVVIVASYRLP